MPSTEDSRELLTQPHQQALSAQTLLPSATTANDETNITNISQQQLTGHSGRHSHDSAQLDLVGNADSSPASHSDLQGVIREAQDLGLEASVVPYNHTATPSTASDAPSHNAMDPSEQLTPKLGSNSHLSDPAEVLIGGAGQSSLGVGSHTEYGRQNVSHRSFSNAAELEFGLEEFEPASMQSDAIDDMLYAEESINDNDNLLVRHQQMLHT